MYHLRQKAHIVHAFTHTWRQSHCAGRKASQNCKAPGTSWLWTRHSFLSRMTTAHVQCSCARCSTAWGMCMTSILSAYCWMHTAISISAGLYDWLAHAPCSQGTIIWDLGLLQEFSQHDIPAMRKVSVSIDCAIVMRVAGVEKTLHLVWDHISHYACCRRSESSSTSLRAKNLRQLLLCLGENHSESTV